MAQLATLCDVEIVAAGQPIAQVTFVSLEIAVPNIPEPPFGADFVGGFSDAAEAVF